MKFNKIFLKISKEAELRISCSSLLHLLIADGKRNFKKVTSNRKKFYIISVSGSFCNLLLLGIKLN